MLIRRSLCALFALLALGLAACGGADGPTQVATGGAPDPGAAATSTTEGSGPGADPTTTAATAADPTTTAATPTTTAAPSTTTAPASGTSDASPVAGLDAAQLQAALAAPGGASGRSLRGPTVDQVTLADGTRVWRVRVPGAFTARSARVAISVGSRRVGEGVLAPDLGTITAVTTDAAGLTAGRPVSYQWEGSPPVAAGNLEVAR
ncbi:MAG: hypothetical protein JWO77_1606 [Ilumatobacteraceae bacterium]|nr:hypothetical protein [Ilumatobacteraceae bacterium]